jgi:uncharacterized membrane protein (DUF2068 family)
MPGRRRRIGWELLSCAWNGHALVGTGAATLDGADGAVVRAGQGGGWFRCLRCDAWSFVARTDPPTCDRVPERAEITLPLRGKPLRDRYVLRLIAVDRGFHVVILAALIAAIFIFATHRQTLQGDFTKILNDLQGGAGGPVTQSRRGILGDLNKLSQVSTTELYVVGLLLTVYTAVLALEAVGLWMARRWAEYLTFVETAVLVPFEIYELTTRVSWLKILTLVINLLIVFYLAIDKRLFGLRGGRPAIQAELDADTGWDAVDRATPPGTAAPAPA